MPTRCAGPLPATLRPPVRPAVTARLEPVALAVPGRASRTSAPPPSGSGPRPTASRYRHEAESRRASSTSSALRATDRAPRAAARRGGDADPPAQPRGRRGDPAAPAGRGGAADAALPHHRRRGAAGGVPRPDAIRLNVRRPSPRSSWLGVLQGKLGPRVRGVKASTGYNHSLTVLSLL